MISTLYTLPASSASTAALITEAGADFENHVVRLEFKQIGHHRNHHRLRDRLIETDWNWPVQVSVLLDLDRHKLVSRRLRHCHKDSLVERGFANLGGDVVGHRPDCRDHLSTLFLKKFRVHERVTIRSTATARVRSMKRKPRTNLEM